VQVVPAGAEEDHLRLIREDDSVGEVGGVGDLISAEAAVENHLVGKIAGQ
jgi:hypothetical protein